MDLEKLGAEYAKKVLKREDLQADPVKQFQAWLEEAYALQILEPNAMVLATCSKAGLPSIRTVLLKNLDERGLTFFTNYESRKAQEINANPQVSVIFLWKELERQVVIQGLAEKTSREVSTSYFDKRPRQSQLGAVASHQGRILSSRKILEEEYERLSVIYEGLKIPCPEKWGGFIIKPYYYEFWQGRTNRLHDRFSYHLAEQIWHIQRLSP
ncbi:Pyridoxine/pyridoxamine 5'-phosphate oxidase|nr:MULTISPECIES: pyridoxamine 5'-phosphate oxidase [unclassified Neochlamydia]MBS4169668.1 Pyridoxine/pyridoxamine 5'-phosphate oxidase [Neochlamydia sp. AcF95]NGY95177.1 Pyridoxine/pyridoxamine 5'-phosphate oxidase [Neochlamydia sp. AcF84]